MKVKLCAIAALLAAGTLGQAQGLRFGAGQQGSQNYGVNAVLAEEIDTKTGLHATLPSFGGAPAYLPLLQSGDLDMVAVVTPDAGDAIRGPGLFKGTALDNLALVTALLPSPVGLMVRADSGIHSIADLAGKRMAWGVPAHASLLPYFEALKLAWVAYLVPLLFAFSPELLLGGSWHRALLAAVTAFAGIAAVSMRAVGYARSPPPSGMRLVYLLAGLCLVLPPSRAPGGGLANPFAAGLLLVLFLKSPGPKDRAEP